MDSFERYLLVRDLVKDPSLTAKEIAKRTGYVVGYVHQLRDKFKYRQRLDEEAKAQEVLEKQREQNLINKLVANAVKKERELWLNQSIPVPLLILYQERHELTLKRLDKLLVACKGVLDAEDAHTHAKLLAELVVTDTQRLLAEIT